MPVGRELLDRAMAGGAHEARGTRSIAARAAGSRRSLPAGPSPTTTTRPVTGCDYPVLPDDSELKAQPVHAAHLRLRPGPPPVLRVDDDVEAHASRG